MWEHQQDKNVFWKRSKYVYYQYEEQSSCSKTVKIKKTVIPYVTKTIE